MKKIMKRFIKIFIVLLLCFMIYIPKIYADPIVNADDYKPPAINNGGKLADIGNVLIGGIQLVGIIISVVVLIILGIKYMMGSAEEKAEYKKTLLPYVIGAGLVFAASTIAGIVFSVAQNI